MLGFAALYPAYGSYDADDGAEPPTNYFLGGLITYGGRPLISRHKAAPGNAR